MWVDKDIWTPEGHSWKVKEARKWAKQREYVIPVVKPHEAIFRHRNDTFNDRLKTSSCHTYERSCHRESKKPKIFNLGQREDCLYFWQTTDSRPSLVAARHAPQAQSCELPVVKYDYSSWKTLYICVLYHYWELQGHSARFGWAIRQRRQNLAYKTPKKPQMGTILKYT